jgi:hypothetical protein
VDFTVEQRFAAPVEAVEAALLDAGFIAGLAELPKIGQAELVSQEREGDVVEQEIRYVFVGELSAAVRAVVDPRKLSWILESRYDLTVHDARWRILPDHYAERLTAEGTNRLTADGAGTRRVMEGHVKVHMALVGGRVERAIISGLKEHAEAEADALARYLDQRSG